MSDRNCSAYADAVALVDELRTKVGELESQLAEVRVAYADLLGAVKFVHRQHADDLCWMPADVNVIFRAAGLPPQDLRVGDKAAMLKNCERYVGCLQSGGPWKSYAELESELDGERKANQILNAGFVSTCEDRDRLKQRVRELEAKSDAEMERVKACEHIAEGDDGWEVLTNLCPSTAAVAHLRRLYQDVQRVLSSDEGAMR